MDLNALKKYIIGLLVALLLSLIAEAKPDDLLQSLRKGAYDNALEELYGTDKAISRNRAIRIANIFKNTFSTSLEKAKLFSVPGRAEIGGNHTDHQHGHVLCGSVNVDMLACAAPNNTRMIRIISDGYPPLEINLDQLAPLENEINTSAALIRGIAAKIIALGYSLKGFDVCINSKLPSGAGLSSSAAFEVLLCQIINYFFCNNKLTSVEIAKISQYAENRYFGKPCGLMDQIGCSVGGLVSIDFADPASPIIKKIEYDFSSSRHTLCIIDTGGYHVNLSEEYAMIPHEMSEIAAVFGEKVLRDVSESRFLEAIPELRTRCGDRAVLRALHFYNDDKIAQEEAAALNCGNFKRFLRLVNASGNSSALYLQNTIPASTPKQQAVQLSIALAKRLLRGKGAVRVHGGGFAGTIEAFVPDDMLQEFKHGIEAVLGKGMCYVLRIRRQGSCMLTPK